MPKRVALVASDWPIYEKFCPHFTGIQDGLRTLGIEYKLFSCRPSFDAEKVVEYNPDFIIYGLLDMVKDHNARMYLRNRLPKAKIVMWYGDYRDQYTGQIHADMSEIDMMFVSNNAQNEFYKKRWKVKECRFLPLGATVRKGEYIKKFDFDFVFIGGQITGGKFLDRYFEIERYKSIGGLKVINADPRSNPELRMKILKSMNDVYYSSKLCLDVSHFTNIDGYTSNRFWNIGASGGVALTKRFPRCEEFYPEGSRLYFDTFEEAIKIKNHYLKHPELLEPIRKKALEIAQNHTYDKRLLEMFKCLLDK